MKSESTVVTIQDGLRINIYFTSVCTKMFLQFSILIEGCVKYSDINETVVLVKYYGIIF